MWSVALLLRALAVHEVVASLERAGKHESAQQLAKALARDDPLSAKLKAFADAAAHEVASVTGSVSDNVGLMKQEAALAQLSGFAAMRKAAREVGLFPKGAAPSSFSQTGSDDFTLADISMPSLAGMAQLEDEDSSETAFERSLDEGALDAGPAFDAPVAAPDLGVDYDYNGDVAPSLSQLTSQLVTEAAESDEETHEEFPSSLAQTQESPDEDPDDSEFTEQQDEAEFAKIARTKRVEPVLVPVGDAKTLALAKKLGIKPPEIEEVHVPIPDALMDRVIKEEEEEAQYDQERNIELSTGYSKRKAAEAEERLAKTKDRLHREAKKHKRSLHDRVQAQEQAQFEELQPLKSTMGVDDDASLKAMIQDAYGGQPLAPEPLASEGEDSLAELGADGHMRTGK